MKKRITAALLLFLCIFSLLVLPASSSGRATLFINDSEWEDDSLLPFIEAEGKLLVPAFAFTKLNNITVTSSDKLGSLLIESEGKFLSYNLNNGTCLDNNDNLTNVSIYRYGGEIYLEPYAICEKFSLEFETAFAPDGYLAARIADGSEMLSFSDLLVSYSNDGSADIPYLYNPSGKTEAGSFMHPILLVPSAANIRAAIPLLGEHRVSFALSPRDISNYINVLPEIYANGHTVVYYMDFASDTDTEIFRQEMTEANKVLFSVIGRTSRIYVYTPMGEEIPKIEGFFPKICAVHLVRDELKSTRTIEITLVESPGKGYFNFSLASDEQTRNHYSFFFEQFDKHETLRSMPLTEASSDK
ncbi:MAG: hypothetical protein IJC81_00830 [Clostridia bacterium]|nr:hypothetical protein [Clostridia bacterium]